MTKSRVQTLTPKDTMTPVGPYSHIAKVDDFITIGGTAIAATGLPKPGTHLTMKLTAGVAE